MFVVYVFTSCLTCEVCNIIIIGLVCSFKSLSHKFSRSKSKDLNVSFFFAGERKERNEKVGDLLLLAY